MDSLEKEEVHEFKITNEALHVKDELDCNSSCDRCHLLQRKVFELERNYNKVQKENAIIKYEYSKYMEYNEKNYEKLYKKYRKMIEDILPTLQKLKN